MSRGVPQHRTLWEEGRKPGRLVANAAGLVVLLAVLIDLFVLGGGLTLVFDVSFVLVCVAAALAVRPRDFFVIGVYPPLLMAGTVAVLSIAARGSVADPRDGFLQAVVSGLAHHAGYLVAGYGLTLAILAIRQVAVRNAGVLRSAVRRPGAPRTGPPPAPPADLPAALRADLRADLPADLPATPAARGSVPPQRPTAPERAAR